MPEGRGPPGNPNEPITCASIIWGCKRRVAQPANALAGLSADWLITTTEEILGLVRSTDSEMP
jgi:hypothetical protein